VGALARVFGPSFISVSAGFIDAMGKFTKEVQSSRKRCCKTSNVIGSGPDPASKEYVWHVTSWAWHACSTLSRQFE
jgi:hypothetical protein